MQEHIQEKVLNQLIVKMEESYLYSKSQNLYKFIIEATEKPLIEHILIKTEGNQLKASRILGINRNTLRSKIRKLGIKLDRINGL